MASNPSDGMEPAKRKEGGVRMTHADLHEVSWKAQLLAQAARSALGAMDIPGAAVAEAEAMMDLLWRLGVRPCEEE